MFRKAEPLSSIDVIRFRARSVEARTDEALKVLRKHPDRIPVIVNIQPSLLRDGCHDMSIPKFKYLVPDHITVGQMLVYFRKHIQLESTTAVFMFINGTLPPVSKGIREIYEENRDNDGFLYVSLLKETCFG